ncbi:hypothetical protein CERSUDRAFT_69186 [Gelatoporia subvermispora B]|uniref:F-box domain-containing protein n=1 Tax=Ceriporiopsis subvermispora (strain B) TaxID=914234 RepID=M2R0A7_CERS8|nr:hypothetical protein CERSUDRAFT_69186 [Gelatoporia subvermispora B]
MDESEGYDSGSSGEYKTYDSGKYELDESGEYESCDSEEFDADEQQECKLEDDPSKDVRVHPLSPGSLPVELWWNTLKIVDDGRALLATGCTCKALCDIVRGIVEKRRRIRVFDLASDPTRGYFLPSAEVNAERLPSWVSTYDMKSLQFRRMEIASSRSGRFLALCPRTRCALSLLTSVTSLLVWETPFSSSTDFARLVCSLPDLATLRLEGVAVNDRGSSTLHGAYFARRLRLKELGIYNCGHLASHLLTASSLSESLKCIEIWSMDRDPQRALQELTVPPAALLSPDLAQLTRLRLNSSCFPCGDARSAMSSSLLFHSAASGHVTAVNIEYGCEHSPPHLSEWNSLFSVLEDALTASDFSSLRTISVSFLAKHPFDAVYVRTLVGSHSHSPKWAAASTMSSMVFKPESADEINSFSEEGSEKTRIATERCTEGIILRIGLGASSEHIAEAAEP